MSAPPTWSNDGKRIARRHKVFQPTTMSSVSGEDRVHLINVSATGALVHFDRAPDIGLHVSIGMANAFRAATVVWTSGARFGIAFTTRLDEDAIRALLER